MKKNFKVLPALCWSLIVVVTALVYFLLVDELFSKPIKWISLCFVLLAEIFLCLKFLTNRKSIILNTQGITGGIYLLAVFVLSIVYTNASDPNVKWFVSIHSILLLVLAIVDLTILNFDLKMSAADTSLANSQSVIFNCLKITEDIIAENKNNELEKPLNELCEAIKYSDNSILTGGEDNIAIALGELKDVMRGSYDVADVLERIRIVKALVKTRSNDLKIKQRGNF